MTVTRYVARSSEGEVGQRPEARSWMVLPKNGDAVDRKRRKIKRDKATAQQRHELVAPLGGGLAGERHVKTEVVHHIGISPAIEVIELGRGQRGWIAARAIFF